MQNRIHYFRSTAGLIVVTNSFLTGSKNDKYGIYEIVDKANFAAMSKFFQAMPEYHLI